MKGDVLTQVILPASLFIIMFGMGLSLKLADFGRVLTKPKAAFIGIFSQMVMLPLVAYFVVIVFGFSAEIAVGLMILAFCPGGTTSNMLTYLSRGDVALSITLTAVISMVTPFTIPLFTALMMELFLEDAQQFSLPFIETALKLFLITIVPVVIAMAVYKRFPRVAQKIEGPIKVFSIVFLFVIIAGIVARSKNEIGGYFAQTGLATFILNVVTLALGYFIAKLTRLPKSQAATIGIEVGMQNGTLAILVAGTLIGSKVV